MDFSMALGLLGALLVFGFAAGDLRAFFDLASLAIVLGGSLSVLLARGFCRVSALAPALDRGTVGPGRSGTARRCGGTGA